MQIKVTVDYDEIENGGVHGASFSLDLGDGMDFHQFDSEVEGFLDMVKQWVLVEQE